MEIGKRSQALLGGAWDFCFCGRREEFTRRTPREEHGEHRERNEGRKNKANAETRRTLRRDGNGRFVALNRKSPPFAKIAKGGAPSSSIVGRRFNRSNSTG
jgi:hypothetical protein